MWVPNLYYLETKDTKKSTSYDWNPGSGQNWVENHFSGALYSVCKLMRLFWGKSLKYLWLVWPEKMINIKISKALPLSFFLDLKILPKIIWNHKQIGLIRPFLFCSPDLTTNAETRNPESYFNHSDWF